MYYKFPTKRKIRKKSNSINLLNNKNYKTNQYNRKPIFVYNLDGSLFKYFSSKEKVKKEMNISKYMLNKI